MPEADLGPELSQMACKAKGEDKGQPKGGLHTHAQTD